MTYWSSAPQKLMAAVLREKGKHEGARAELFLHRNSWIQWDIPNPQYHWAVISRTWGRIWDSALCSWLTKCKELAFSWSRGLYSPSGLGVMSLFINTFVPSQFCFRHQHNMSFTPAELLLCPKCCQFKGLWLSSSEGQSFLGQMPYGLWNLGLWDVETFSLFSKVLETVSCNQKSLFWNAVTLQLVNTFSQLLWGLWMSLLKGNKN